MIEVDSDEIWDMLAFGATLLNAGKEKRISINDSRVGRLWSGRRVNPVIDLQQWRSFAATIGAAREVLDLVEGVRSLLESPKGGAKPGNARPARLDED